MCFLLFLVVLVNILQYSVYSYGNHPTSVDDNELHGMRWFPAFSVCYPPLGCFSRNGPMRQVAFLPDSPEKIGTRFTLFSAQNASHGESIHYNNNDTFATIDRNASLAIIIHGFADDGDNSRIIRLKNSLLTRLGFVIITDWRKGAKGPNYLRAAANTQLVGRQVTALAREIGAKRDVCPKNVHLIGVSLGAHVASFAAAWSIRLHLAPYGRITALDAAAPFFEGFNVGISKKDGLFVDAIHTSAGFNIFKHQFGVRNPVGHVDFYPNGGEKQPHCEAEADPNCNHLAALDFFEASIHGIRGCDFPSIQCDSWEKYVQNKCDPKNVSKMGYSSVREKGRGRQYLATTKHFPYCIYSTFAANSV